MAPLASSGSCSSDYFSEDDPSFLQALEETVLPGDIERKSPNNDELESDDDYGALPLSQPCLKRRYLSSSDDEQGIQHKDSGDDPFEPPPLTQPCLKRRSDDGSLSDIDEGDGSSAKTLPTKRRRAGQDDDAIYGPSHFGDFGEYMHRKRAKLQIQNSEFESNVGCIFKGLAIYINGWTQPSVQELRQLIVKHGGVFQPYLDKKSIVTHILTCSLTPAKLREFKNMKVVQPNWIVKSAEQGILLPWQDYVFSASERLDGTQGPKTNQQLLPTVSRPLPTLSKTEANTSTLNLPYYASHTSNPLAERAMARPGWRNAHTSVAPDFIEGYYKNSRLHHLSTWKAELKNLVKEAQERAESGNATKVGLEEDPETTGGVSMRGAEFVIRSPSKKGKGRAELEERVIMHCDFDCFFVSAGLINRSQLRGKPVVVCHSQGDQGGGSSTSEIASCSYEARDFGIKNGMSLQQARKLCPTIITIPYEFELYKQFSLRFYTVLMTHADDLQAVSVDEALIDVTSIVNRLRAKAKGVVDPAKELAETIRAEVKKSTGCEISIGISYNILLARLATRRAKPAGSYHLLQHDVAEFIASLDISSLHGFGSSAKQKVVDKFGVSTLGELVTKSKVALCDVLGKGTGETLYNAIRGVDDKKLESDKARKSVSCEINYGIRFENNEQAETFIRQMAVEVTKRLNDVSMLGRSMTLKIMKRDPHAPVEPPKFLGHGACDVFNKQGPLADPSGRATNDENVIGDHAWRMLKSLNFDPKELRGIGIQIQKLESKDAAVNPGQKTLPFLVESNSKRDPPRPVEQPPPVEPPPQETRASVPSWDLPSFSQLDQSVYDALPEDIRGELDQEYKRRSESPFVPPPLPPRRYPTVYVPFLGSRARTIPVPSLLPQRPNVNVRHITQQLAPRNLPVYSSNKKRTSFFGKRMGMGTTARFRMTDDDLRNFDIDPEVFFALPKNVQREQLTRARLLKQEGGIPEVSDEHKSLRPRKRLYSLDGIYRAPPPQAKYPEVPVLRQRGKEKGEKLCFTEADDIQNILEAWVTRFTKRPPNKKDVEFFSKFLVRSVDCDTASGVGVEKAIAIVKWWLVLLRRNWRDFEHETFEAHEHDSEETRTRRAVAEAWWQMFRNVKEEMDVVARKKFGGKLSLR
ncbi:DNA repair protein [Guyanagaster necrorhizus]|uniref:DNA repair protein REV1 n=1 Tax=Guyanagaster necrorhizus TaxID=856835 RepID=A0A9P8ANU5_9AGAR|nr:DNA repair protein [Guyanagaster necrorhizus MCA 3950]KAG7442234.1 DNA repair protein [Guyanagaster necrorhizus MCA 3950]